MHDNTMKGSHLQTGEAGVFEQSVDEVRLDDWKVDWSFAAHDGYYHIMYTLKFGSWNI